MKSIWKIADWWWWLVDTIGGSTALKLERWYWTAYRHCDWWYNHLSWKVRYCRMRYWAWYYTHVPDSVTLALCALFAFCVAAAFSLVGLALYGFWCLVY